MRLYPALLWLLCLLAMIGQHLLVPGWRLLPPPWHLAGFLLVAGGIALGVWGVATFRRRKTNIHPFREPGVLVTEGPYRFTRNPMYLGLAATLLGAALIVDDVLALVFVALFVLLADRWYVQSEERLAEARFGAAFDDYRARVRRWL